MRFLLSILVLLLLLSSCQDINEVDKPDNLISKEKMADILVELSLLQGAKSSNRMAFEQTGIHPRSYVWERFDIDSVQFVESSNYYSANYREYEEIYKRVQARLEQLKIKYDSITSEERKINDSLRKADPEELIELKEEQSFRDSILGLTPEPRKQLLEPVSDSIFNDTVED